MKRLALVILFAGVLLACSKSSTVSGNAAAFTSNLQIQANDYLRLSTELDAAFNDIDSALGKAPAVCGGAITVDSVDTPRVITITYSGNTCNALRNRTGTIRIASKPGTSWNTAGDTATVTFATVVVTRLADSKTLTINGGFTYINISGGALAGLSTSGATPVVHTISGLNINIRYDDGTTTTWQFARRRTYTYKSGIVVSTLGMDSVGGFAGVADWGGNRFGNSVIAAPSSPLLISQACNSQMTGGQETLNNPVGVTALTFGLDSLGKTATGCPITGGHYFYSLSWTGTGENPYSTLLPYY